MLCNCSALITPKFLFETHSFKYFFISIIYARNPLIFVFFSAPESWLAFSSWFHPRTKARWLSFLRNWFPLMALCLCLHVASKQHNEYLCILLSRSLSLSLSLSLCYPLSLSSTCKTQIMLMTSLNHPGVVHLGHIDIFPINYVYLIKFHLYLLPFHRRPGLL